MPNTMFHSSSTSRAPRMWGGDTSDMYKGATMDKVPMPTPTRGYWAKVDKVIHIRTYRQ